MAEKTGKMRDRIAAYGLRSTVTAAADKILRRQKRDVTYSQWQDETRLSSRDYARMGRKKLPYTPTFAVRAYGHDGDRAALIQSLNLQIYRNFHPLKDYPDAEYTLLCGSGCTLAPELLWRCAEYLGNIHSKPDLIYFDSDRIGADGRKSLPAFRPDYDPDLLCRVNYMGNAVLVRTAAARNVGFPGDGEESFYAFLKRVCLSHDIPAGQESEGPVRHIPRVLYHEDGVDISGMAGTSGGVVAAEKGEDKFGAEESYRLEVNAAMDVKKTEARESGTDNIYGGESEKPLITVIIPNKDHKEDLARCIVSLQHINTWDRLEILIVENNSRNKETFSFYEELQKSDPRIRVLTYEGPFNYSAVNNFAASYASGDLLLLLNNDASVLSRGSIDSLAQLAMRDDVGAAGALLLYPDHTVQHGGIILGYGGIAGHAFSGETETGLSGTYPGLIFRTVHNVSAVTAACMMLKRSTFLEADGFDEELGVTFNDVDLCLRLREKGLRILMCPQARLIHNESASRGSEDSREKVERFHGEIRVFVRKWKNELEKGDPFYNPNLTLTGRTWTCRDVRRDSVRPYVKYLDF